MTRARFACAAGLAFACAQAPGAPPLEVPHGRVGQQAGATGPSALWQGRDGVSFIIEARSPAGGTTGTLVRRTLTVGSGGAVRIAATPTWDAGAILAGGPNAAPRPAPAARNIYTFDAQAGAAVPLTWESLPQDLRAALDAGGRGEARTGFLRGERGGEQPAGPFRARFGVLGDVVHSTPLIVGPPAASFPGREHGEFIERLRNRPMAVYVGTNDGMLHAFAADDGRELFAFVPGVLAGQLAGLSDPAYQPRPWVDASAGAGDAQVGASWRTVLASGMGMGARGVFALDITDPARFGQGAGALWEFTDQDDPAIGHVRAAPLLARITQGPARKAGAERYFAVVSSGINSLAADGSGALFLLALDKQASSGWTEGGNYVRISTARGDDALPNALSDPALVTDGDGRAIYAYAGDLQGNLWRFDLAARKAILLFAARDEGGAPQPIAHAPRVVFAPGGGYLVVFGTGRLIEAADLGTASYTQQSMYAIHDALEAKPAVIRSRSRLAARTLTGTDRYSFKGETLDLLAPGGKKGWYFDFPNSITEGERAAASPSSVGGAVVLVTFVPGARQGMRPSSRVYMVDALAGLPLDASGAIHPAAVTGDSVRADSPAPPLLVATGASTGERNATGGATATTSVTLIRPQAGGKSAEVTLKVRFPAKRLGWREVSNWQELHDAASK